MEIRALTGFDLGTREQFGRSYSPLSGCNPALGAISGGYPSSKDLSSQYTIPTYVPPQQIEMVDVQTGKKKWLTVDNAEKLAALIRQGMAIWGTIRGGSGSQTVQGPRPNPNVKTNTSMGINPMLIYGGVAVAIVAIALIMSKK